MRKFKDVKKNLDPIEEGKPDKTGKVKFLFPKSREIIKENGLENYDIEFPSGIKATLSVDFPNKGEFMDPLRHKSRMYLDTKMLITVSDMEKHIKADKDMWFENMIDLTIAYLKQMKKED